MSDQQQAGVWIAGRSGWSGVRPDDVGLARQVKQAAWEVAGSSSLTGVRLDRMALAFVRNRFPTAVDTFGEASILALLRRTGPKTCKWCAARVLSAVKDEPPPKPTAALGELLGRPCGRCKVAHDAAEIAERESALMAAGYRRGQEPAPTGMLWRAGQEPSDLLASARRAASRPSSYYTPNRGPTGR